MIIYETKQPVNITDVYTLFDKAQIEAIQDEQEFEPNMCHMNASIALALGDNVQYVEGFIFIGGEYIAHAFNKIGNAYFDITATCILTMSL